MFFNNVLFWLKWEKKCVRNFCFGLALVLLFIYDLFLVMVTLFLYFWNLCVVKQSKYYFGHSLPHFILLLIIGPLFHSFEITFDLARIPSLHSILFFIFLFCPHFYSIEYRTILFPLSFTIILHFILNNETQRLFSWLKSFLFVFGSPKSSLLAEIFLVLVLKWRMIINLSQSWKIVCKPWRSHFSDNQLWKY